MVRTSKLFIILILLTFSITAYAHTFYKWVDEKGIVNYTDYYNSIPAAYRNRVEIEWVHEEGSSLSHDSMKSPYLPLYKAGFKGDY
jgi:hypothetical protein